MQLLLSVQVTRYCCSSVRLLVLKIRLSQGRLGLFSVLVYSLKFALHASAGDEDDARGSRAEGLCARRAEAAGAAASIPRCAKYMQI